MESFPGVFLWYGPNRLPYFADPAPGPSPALRSVSSPRIVLPVTSLFFALGGQNPLSGLNPLHVLIVVPLPWSLFFWLSNPFFLSSDWIFSRKAWSLVPLSVFYIFLIIPFMFCFELSTLPPCERLSPPYHTSLLLILYHERFFCEENPAPLLPRYSAF